jgi:hypothetical protein
MNISEENNSSSLLTIKPLEKLGHLHTKTLNRLQTALLEHDFVVQYKKGTNMPGDYLSRLPLFPINSLEAPAIAAFDPFSPDLQLLQRQDQDLQAIFQFLKNGTWLDSLSKQKIRVLACLAPKVFFDKNKLAWITTLQGQLCGYWKGTERRLCVKHMTPFSLAIMRL